jgi:transcriptional regulator with XRE-family HTH domain
MMMTPAIHPAPPLPRSVIEGLPPIRRLRKLRNMSQAELAHEAGIDPAHLDLIERQSDVAAASRADMEAIAAALGVTVADLR